MDDTVEDLIIAGESLERDVSHTLECLRLVRKFKERKRGQHEWSCVLALVDTLVDDIAHDLELLREAADGLRREVDASLAFPQQIR